MCGSRSVAGDLFVKFFDIATTTCHHFGAGFQTGTDRGDRCIDLVARIDPSPTRRHKADSDVIIQVRAECLDIASQSLQLDPAPPERAQELPLDQGGCCISARRR